jgi:serine/threonine protein kinase/formylglycine-generating enzyme required for sulfatase activity
LTDERDDQLDEDSLDQVLDRGFKAAGDAAKRDQSSPGDSVLDRIGELTGSKPRVSLRDAEEQGHTPILKPLGPDDERAAGKYVIQGELGRGGVGAVHKGHDQDLGRDVAMKFLHERYKDEPSVLQRFVEEAQIGGQLQHPGIVPVYELGMSDGRPFFTMKMVKGQTLAKKLAKRESVASDRRTFLSIFEDICQTMAYAHARGVVHRDLKPANIMIGSFGEVQVVDWGMGKVLQSGGVADEKLAAEEQSRLSVIETLRSSGHGTQSIMGSVMGTPAYMPPEQARGDVEAMNERSDVFALGAILCEILTGEPPYVGDQNELIAMAAMGKLDDAHARLAACSAEADLVELTTQCLMPAPAARPQSAEEVAQAIHDHLATAENRVHEARIEAAQAEGRTLAMKRTQKLGIALTGVIAIGLAASLWFWQDADTQRGLADQRATEASNARDLAQASLANFNRLSHVVRLETATADEKALYPAWPEKAASMRSWLDGDATTLREALPELRATLSNLEKTSALPQTEAQQGADMQMHPRVAEFETLRGKLKSWQRAQAVRSGSQRPEAFVLDESKLPTTAQELNALAWPLVDPDRTVFGREAEGLALAQRAVSVAPVTGDERAQVTDTLAWALFSNGLDYDALAQSKAALAAIGKAKRVEYEGYLKKLEALVAGAKSEDSATAVGQLTTEVAALQAEVGMRQTWTFADASDQFLHSTLQKLVTGIEAFAATEIAAVAQRLSWAERVKELTHARQDLWDQAKAAIGDANGVTASKLYVASSIELVPQMGLVPLGMNPVTKLWEFYHLRSAWDGTSDPAEITLPTHREDGSIDVTGDTGIVFVLLPGGTHIVGAQKDDPTAPNYDAQAQPNEIPHEVTLAPFLLARHELTQGQWARLWSGDKSLRDPSYYKAGQTPDGVQRITSANPVEGVDWPMSDQLLTRHRLVLPSEAQWEYGCRGNTETPYWCDAADLKDFANVADATAKRASVPWTCETWSDGHVVHAPVGTFGANGFGLHDMHGNVWEWCRSLYGSSSNRVDRGGSFDMPTVNARSAYRNGNAGAFLNGNLGLRPARTLRLRD